MSLQDAKTLAEFVLLLKQEQGDSFVSLAKKVGVSHTTLHRIANGGDTEDETIEKLAEYTHESVIWLKKLAGRLVERPQYPQTTNLVASLVEQMPEDLRELFLEQARALLKASKKQSAKHNQESD